VVFSVHDRNVTDISYIKICDFQLFQLEIINISVNECWVLEVIYKKAMLCRVYREIYPPIQHSCFTKNTSTALLLANQNCDYFMNITCITHVIHVVRGVLGVQNIECSKK